MSPRRLLSAINRWLDRAGNKIDLILVIAIVIGIAVRAYKLGSIPPGLNQDEASTAYDAFSLINYGVDRNGSHFPVVLISWGSGMYALASYTQMLFIKLLGLSIFSARLPFFLAGIAAIPLFYVLMRDLFDQKTARIAAILLAISPWHIMISRWGLDSNMFPFFFLAATVCLAKSQRNPTLMSWAAILYALSVYGYGTAYVVVPVFALLVLVYGWKHALWKPKTIGISAGVFALIALPILLFVLINKFQWSAIETPFFTIPRLTGVPRFETMGNTNIFSGAFYGSAFNNLKDAFWMFIKQDDGLPWNAIDEYGIMFPFSTILAVIGFAILCGRMWKKQFDASFILLSWCIASFVLTLFVSVNINRANIAMFPFIACIAIAVAYLWHYRSAATALSLVFCVYFVMFIYSYFGRYVNELKGAFFYSFGDAIEYAAQETDGPICVTGNVNMPYIFVLFHTQEDPHIFSESVQYDNPGAEFQGVGSYGRYRFGLDRCRYDSEVIIATNDEVSSFDTNEFSAQPFELYTVLTKR